MKSAAVEDVGKGFCDEHGLACAQQQQVGAIDGESVEVGDKAEAEQDAGGRSEAPTPADFGER